MKRAQTSWTSSNRQRQCPPHDATRHQRRRAATWLQGGDAQRILREAVPPPESLNATGDLWLCGRRRTAGSSTTGRRSASETFHRDVANWGPVCDADANDAYRIGRHLTTSPWSHACTFARSRRQSPALPPQSAGAEMPRVIAGHRPAPAAAARHPVLDLLALALASGRALQILAETPQDIAALLTRQPPDQRRRASTAATCCRRRVGSKFLDVRRNR